MTSLGDEIAVYLQAQSLGLNFNGAGTINMFSTLLPDQPDLAACVIERGGLPTVMWLTGTNPRVNESKLDRPVFQIRVRSGMTGYTAGNTLTEGIFSSLQGITEQVLNMGGSFFHLIASLQSPVYLGRDLKERHEWSQNYQTWWENGQR